MSQLPTRAKVDAGCHDLTSPWIREQAASNPDIELCEFFEGFERTGRDAVLAPGVYSLDDFREMVFGYSKRIFVVIGYRDEPRLGVHTMQRDISLLKRILLFMHISTFLIRAFRD